MKLFVSFQTDAAAHFPQKWWASGKRNVTMTTTFMEYPIWNASFLWYKRETGLKESYWAPTSFPELVHVNFSIIFGKSCWPCLFCAVVQLATFSLDHVIDALAADVVITRAQTINRSWNFEGLVNMVQESSAIDWLKAFTCVGVYNTGTRNLVAWRSDVQGQENRTESWPANMMNHFRVWSHRCRLEKTNQLQ